MATSEVFRDRTLHVDGIVQGVRLHAPGWEEPEAHGATVNDSGFASCQECHGLGLDGGTARLSCQDGCHGPGWIDDCTFCHGGQVDDTGAPPYGNLGETARTNVTVGAHSEHVLDTLLHAGRLCSECHTEPLSVFSPGHIDGDGVAEVIFGPINPEATYNPETAVCSNLWCHGNGASRFGSAQWDTDLSLVCGSCHSMSGRALSGRHWHARYGCHWCHDETVAPDNTIINLSLHANGEVDVYPIFDPEANGGRGRCERDCHGARDWY